MRKVIGCLMAVLCAGVGGYLASGGGEDDRSEAWCRWHLEVIQAQLTDLKTLLVEYRNAHGRYPTNDEGLAVLDNFDARFVVRCPRALPSRDLPPLHALFSTYRGKVREWLSEFRREHGRAPRNQEELEEAGPGLLLETPGIADPNDLIQIELAIGKGDKLFLLSPAGVLSPWQVPYVYENRKGLDPKLFADSPANRDPKGRYSVRVHDGIYVYSVGGELYVQDERQLWWERTRPRLVGVALLAAAVALAVFVVRGKAIVLGLLAVAGPGALGFAVGTGHYLTCYIMSPLFYRRNSQMVARQKELLGKYRDRGVITRATYDRAMSAIERGAASQPATADGNSP
ncbi:MAG TPA: hypothetical protein VNA25_00105 [Phycisphaerae bacterium]|nr:hypothetical protein [Phycisphaerae bacterium]